MDASLSTTNLNAMHKKTEIFIASFEPSICKNYLIDD